jgi:hypothetical protein
MGQHAYKAVTASGYLLKVSAFCLNKNTTKLYAVYIRVVIVRI